MNSRLSHESQTKSLEKGKIEGKRINSKNIVLIKRQFLLNFGN